LRGKPHRRQTAGDIGGLFGSIVFVERGDQLLGTFLAPLKLSAALEDEIS
jgi:hypothetical protein